jgi:putative membrane protein
MSLFHWIMPWDFSILFLLAVGLTVHVYVSGLRRAAHPPLRKLGFASGIALLYIVSHTQFDYYAAHQFFIHRIQHTVQHHLAPFLIVLSRPGAILAAGLPACLRHRLGKAAATSPVRMSAFALCHPVTQVLLFTGLILFWLVPGIHFLAMLDWRLYRLMNWGMIADGLLFWGLALAPPAAWAHRYGPGWRLFMMLAVIPPQIVMGSLLFLTPHDLYPVYGICGRAFGGLDPLADQQLGGLILWVPAAMMSVIGILILLRRMWLRG